MELVPEDATMKTITLQPPAPFELTREYFLKRGGLRGQKETLMRISKRHATLEWDGDTLALRNHSTTTAVGGVLVPQAPGARAHLREGDRVTLLADGGLAFRVRRSWPRFTPWRLWRTEACGDGAGNAGALALCDVVRDARGAPPRWAVISNFMVDTTWLASAWPALGAVGRIVVFHGKRELPRKARERGELPAHVEYHDRTPHGLTFAPRADQPHATAPWSNAFGCHHAKYLLLGFADGLRVVVHTANMIYVDMHDKTNSVYVQDFPRKRAATAADAAAAAPAASPFEESLRDYVRTLLAHGGPASERRAWPGEEAPAALDELLARYDFSRAYAHLVPTAPGHHVGAERFKWGHPRVRTLLERDGACFPRRCAGAGASTVFMQFSSFSASPDGLFEQYAQSFGAGACRPASAGEDDEREGGGEAVAPRLGMPTDRDFVIVWPTVREVQQGVGGYSAGESIPSLRKCVEDVPREIFRAWADADVASSDDGSFASARLRARARAMPHNKCYGRVASDGSQEFAWFLLRCELDRLVCTRG